MPSSSALPVPMNFPCILTIVRDLFRQRLLELVRQHLLFPAGAVESLQTIVPESAPWTTSTTTFVMTVSLVAHVYHAVMP